MNKFPFELETRKVLIKKEAETSSQFGGDPENLPVDQLIKYGVVCINKPSGPTSHQVSAYVQQILGIDKSGHSGTLDPRVTGVLPVALGRATRIVEVLLKTGKEYVAIMHVHSDLPEGKIRDICDKFVGKIKQLPPIKSAIKRRLRERTIYYLEILEVNGRDVLFKVGCEAGTYIRKLIHDIGVKLGSNAHMAELIRTKVAVFNDKNWVSLQDLSDALYFYKEKGDESFIRKAIMPVEKAVKFLPKIWIFDTAVEALCHGSDLKIPGISKLETEIHPGKTVAIMTLKDELVGLGEAHQTSEVIMEKTKGIAVKVKKVFMEPRTYPRIERS